ncbi:FAD-dependent oxidoreductase [Robiginitalea sp. M366]|uniref:NAD(P)/FAD-dependent oxidoreductase n=1 Tax=Robiginitalea aestuariiviva TaxID=3036903 RepID=UPI00240DC91F|nr:FAD-dependent oxidoreductase [Robiginitalea aestuariiviva]MDG1571908.1 FAD-dependent oxidoreductase [Robiginitalea aestuariiviva]
MADYLIIGGGLAGMAMAETLQQAGASFHLFDDSSQRASHVAGGLYNPVVLKRMNLSWQGDRLMAHSIPFYETLQARLGVHIDLKQTVLRRFASIQEQNAWFEALDKPGLSDFLDPKIHPNRNPALEAPHGFGRVRHTGRIDTGALLAAYGETLREAGLLSTSAFEHEALEMRQDGVNYKGMEARGVIFCEGFGMLGNPYFNTLPLQGTKGELLTIRAPELQEASVIKSGVFIIPLGNDRYRVGATYAWNDYTQEPTARAREQLLTKLKPFLRCPFEVEGQVAGIRPTVPDRRPLVGQHPDHPQLYVLNGLGSRGVLIAPYAAACLWGLICEGRPLPPEMDAARYFRTHTAS